FAQRYGIPMRTSLINEARNRIKKYINAYIAMNFFDLQGYYQLQVLQQDVAGYFKLHCVYIYWFLTKVGLFIQPTSYHRKTIP
ncbi:hypothetical protein CLI75_12510, partial [Porphyromonas gingivalis]|uniref:hypothetical protein n=1 Tax=Porphyromonas gingivalis TaxID=837 RepID=UPI000BE75E80